MQTANQVEPYMQVANTLPNHLNSNQSNSVLSLGGSQNPGIDGTSSYHKSANQLQPNFPLTTQQGLELTVVQWSSGQPQHWQDHYQSPGLPQSPLSGAFSSRTFSSNRRQNIKPGHPLQLQQQQNSDPSQSAGSKQFPQPKGAHPSNRLPQNVYHQNGSELPPFPNNPAFQITGGPAGNGQGNPSQHQNAPQFHFIANQQKFYAQISPERAPFIFGDKRPYTASSVNNSQVKKQTRTGSNGKQLNQGSQSSQNPPALYLGSKTHGVGFNLGNFMNNQGASNQLASQMRFGNSAGFENNPQSQMASIFSSAGFNQNLGPSQLPNQLSQLHKVSKIKPNKGSLKEKESLYEEAIKLKIQANTYKDENVKLKTKIKILENEMGKKEKALEDFFAQNIQLQQNQKQSNSNQNLAPVSSAAQKIQSETYLVMSLKKQVKELKFDMQRKDEELDLFKRNIKGTKIQEIEVEIKAYKDECSRLRTLLEDMLSHGTKLPLQQQTPNDQLVILEEQLREKENQIQVVLREKDELYSIFQEQQAKKPEPQEDKHKKAIASELAKAKKTMREREKEIAKLKNEIVTIKKVEKTQAAEKEQSKDQQDTQTQMKNLQSKLALKEKNLKDVLAEVKQKKEKVEEQDVVIKKLQERLQSKIDELSSEQKRLKIAQQDLEKMQSKTKQDVKKEEELKQLENKSEKDFCLLRLVGQKNKVGAELLAHRLKTKGVDTVGSSFSFSEELKKLVGLSSEVQLYSLIKDYSIHSQKEEEEIEEGILQKIRDKASEAKEAIGSGTVKMEKVKGELTKLKVEINEIEEEVLQSKYVKQDTQGDICLSLEDFFEKLEQTNTKETEPKKARPQTAKRPAFEKKQPSSEALKKIDELKDKEEDNYEEEAFDKLEDDPPMTATGDLGIEKQEEEIEPPKPGTLEGQAEEKGIEIKDQKEEAKQKSPEDKEGILEEEEMLDIAEHCFIRIAELMIERSRSVRGIFTKYSVPEQFPDGTILELMSPIAFLEGVKELGLDDLQEMEAACLLRVLTKPELESAIILNELVLIMENFGVVDNYDDEEEDDDDDCAPEEGEEEGEGKEKGEEASTAKKKKIQLDFEKLEPKGLKILKKLARFLLERYMHPREFFGPAIYKQSVKTQKKDNFVDIIQTKDFYLRLKLAGIRKTVKEIDNLNQFLGLDVSYKNLMHVKKVVKALEEVAQEEQIKLHEEMQARMLEEEEKLKNNDLIEDEIMKKNEALYTGGPGMGIIGAGMNDFYNPQKQASLQQYSALSGGALGGFSMMPTALSSGKMMFMNHFNNLNTIEEEKHETQTSNYFKEGESERDDSKVLQNQSQQNRGSRILADINREVDSKGSPATNKTNLAEGEEISKKDSINKGSPQISRRDPDYNFKASEVQREEENYEEEEMQEQEEEGEQEKNEEKEGEEEEMNDDYVYEEDEEEGEAEEKKEEEEQQDEVEEECIDESPRIETEKDENNKSIADMQSVESGGMEKEEIEESQDYEF